MGEPARGLGPRVLFLSVLVLLVLSARVLFALEPDGKWLRQGDMAELGDYYALVIAVDDYTPASRRLTTAVRDAKALAGVLKQRYGFRDVVTLYDKAATLKAIKRELVRLASKAKERDSVLIYFAGHGVLEGGTGYWVPADAAAGQSWDYLEHVVIAGLVKRERLKARHVLIVADSCFNAGLLKSGRRPAQMMPDDLHKAIRGVSRQCLTSGGPHPVADGASSVFAKSLLKQLASPPRSVFTVSEMAAGLARDVESARRRLRGLSQEPALATIDKTGAAATGEFVFVEERGAATVAQSPRKAPTLQLTVEPPGCVIFLDGVKRVMGEEQKSLTVPLQPGRHVLRVTKDGFVAKEAAFVSGKGDVRATAALVPGVKKVEVRASKSTSGPEETIVGTLKKEHDRLLVIAVPKPDGGERTRFIAKSRISERKDVLVGEEGADSRLTVVVPRDPTVVGASDPERSSKPPFIHEWAKGRTHYTQAAAAKRADMAITRELSLSGSAAMRLILVPAGRFIMGSSSEGDGHTSDEEPAHGVRITRPFYMGIYEVTQAQYESVMGENPSRFRDPAAPVENVSWEDATAFCRKLSESSGFEVRLPTESEWEYACRAGKRGPYSTNHHRISSRFLNYASRPLSTRGPHSRDSYRGKTVKADSYQPNAWGLYHMHGNVWEWCNDWYGKDAYARGQETDPQGPERGRYRVVRGGSWASRKTALRWTARSRQLPDRGNDRTGFRVVVTAK